jgi:hypothetical protein
MKTKSRSDELLPHLIPRYIVLLWDKGYGVTSIADIVERHHNTVRYHLKKEGRIGSYDRPGRPTDSDREQMTVRQKVVRLPARLQAVVRVKCGGSKTKRG